MKYAQITNGIVASITESATVISGPDIVQTDDFSKIGFGYDNGTFTAPPPPVIAPVPRHISVGAFFDRFGAQKYPILASADPGVKALITDCSVRRYIDLDNPALPYGLAMLVAAGFAVVPADIINAEILAGERA